MPYRKSLFVGLLSLLTALSSKGATVSTGDLGENVITAAGAYTWSPTVTSLTNGLPATLAVTYGLWNDPPMTVHAYVNDTEVGSFLVNNPFCCEPATATFNFTNLLVEGANTIRLDGLGANEGEYVISRIDLTYNIPVPGETNNPPSTNEPISGPFVRSGTAVLHYLNRAALQAVAGSKVNGTVRLQLNEQGGSALQKLDLNASGLNSNTTYLLVVALVGEAEASAVGTVVSDSHGRVRFSLKGGEEENLPPQLDPVTDIVGIGLAPLDSTQVLTWAAVNASSNFQYQVERNLTQQDTNATPEGSISLEANGSSVNFHLLAGGLVPNSTYRLALNGAVVMTLTSDSGGAVEVTTWPAGAPAVLDLRTLALLDSSNNAVLSTLLPK